VVEQHDTGLSGLSWTLGEHVIAAGRYLLLRGHLPLRSEGGLVGDILGQRRDGLLRPLPLRPAAGQRPASTQREEYRMALLGLHSEDGTSLAVMSSTGACVNDAIADITQQLAPLTC